MDDFMIKNNYLSVQVCVGKLCERETQEGMILENEYNIRRDN